MSSPLHFFGRLGAFALAIPVASAQPQLPPGLCTIQEIDPGYAVPTFVPVVVEVDSTLCFIAKPNEPNAGIDVARRDPATGNWPIVYTLNSPAGMGAPALGFGRALDFDGSRLAVAHPEADEIWIWDASSPGPPQRIAHDFPGSFHASLRLVEDVLVASHEAPVAGRPYVATYERDVSSGAWGRMADAEAPMSGFGATSSWGQDFDFDGLHLLVGDDRADSDAGGISLLRYFNGAWTRVMDEPGAPHSRFGEQVTMDDTVFAVRSARSNPDVSIYRYLPGTGGFIRSQVFRPSDVNLISTSSTFGEQLELSLGTLVIATPGWEDPSTVFPGDGALTLLRLNPVTNLFRLERNIPNNVPGGPFVGRALGSSLAFHDGLLSSVRWRPTAGVGLRLLVDVFLPGTTDCDGSGLPDTCEIYARQSFDDNRNGFTDSCEDTGRRFCGQSSNNSAGERGRLTLFGPPRTLLFNMEFHCGGLPPGSTGYILSSRSNSTVISPGPATGELCIAGGTIGRGIGGVRTADGNGRFRIFHSRAVAPWPNGLEPILPGQTWYFQAWYRDVGGPASSSRFTNAVEVDFVFL